MEVDYTNFVQAMGGVYGRTLNVFVTHRWGVDDELRELIEQFNSRESGISIESWSISPDAPIEGRNGGHLPRAVVKAKIADRLRFCDVIVAPSKRMKTENAYWIEWELETAALALEKPIIFVDHKHKQQKRTQLLSDLRAADADVHLLQRELDGSINLLGKFVEIIRSTAKPAPTIAAE